MTSSTPRPQRVVAAAPAPARDRGQGTLEYVGVLALVAVLIGALVIAVNPRFGAAAVRAACVIVTLGQGSCDGDDPAPTGEDEEGWWCRNVGWFCGGDEQDDGGDVVEDEDEGDDGFWCFLPWACNEDEDDPPPPTPEPTATPRPTDPANGLPVVDGVTIPEGLRPDEDAVVDLLLTEQGRATLQWLADNGIRVTISIDGTYWRESSQLIFIDTELTPDQRLRSIVHEARHAREDVEGTGADRETTTRDEYVERMLDEESRAVADEVVVTRATREAGGTAFPDNADSAYWKAYDAALAAGQDEESAAGAGVAAVRELFVNGTFRTSTTGQAYVEYYQDQWDKGQG